MSTKAKQEWVVLGALVFLTIGFIMVMPGCSGKGQPGDFDTAMQQEDPHGTAEEETASVEPQVLEPDQEESAEDETDFLAAGLVDRGVPCRTHKYYVPPSSTETLAFEVHLKTRQMENFDPADLEIRKNEWAEYGIEVSIADAEVETATATYPVWKIDGQAFYQDVQELGYRPTNLAIGNILINWRSDGSGVISRIRGYGTARSVGKYTAEELKKEIGGDELTLYHTVERSGKVYTWDLETEEAQEEVRILKFSLGVTLPQGAPEIKERSLHVWGDVRGWGIRASYSPARGRFIITGPASGPDCFKEE